MGVLGNILTPISCCYIAVVGYLCRIYVQQEKGWQAVLLVVLSLPLFFHLPILGFHNYLFLDHVQVTPDAIPYSLYFNYDKTVFPVFLLGFSENKLSRKKIVDILKKVVLYIGILAPVMLGASWLLNYVHFSPKWPYYTPIWMLTNLFFTCTAEEMLFRGVIQAQLQKHIKSVHAGYSALIISAIFFGAMHYAGGVYYILLATIAGLFYGHIYYSTREIRSSIFLHFMLNTLHFLLFTYPALR